MTAVTGIGAICKGLSKITPNEVLQPDASIITPARTPSPELRTSLRALFAPSVYAKIWGVAMRQQSSVSTCFNSNMWARYTNVIKPSPPEAMPEYTLPGQSEYQCTDASFWTSGFFPGSLYLLYERRAKWPDKFRATGQPHVLKLQSAARWWSQNLHAQANLMGTHDLGFLIHPWARLGWELDQDAACYKSMVVAAQGLAARFDPRVGCIRSWDTCYTKRYSFADPRDDFLVIIDNMMSPY